MGESDFRSPDAREEAGLAAERDEAVMERDPGPVDDVEAQQLVDGRTAPPEVGENYREALERGANQQGEGRLP